MLYNPGQLFSRLSCLLLVSASLAAGAPLGKDPIAVSESDWTALRAEYERHRHSAVARDGGVTARNPGQRWLTRFDDRGFTVRPHAADWTWGLELESFGLAGAMRAAVAASPAADGNRVRYRRDGLEEWFVNDGKGLEQGFTLAKRPHGEGLLQIDLSVRGGLTPQLSAGEVSFVDANGSAVVRYNGLKAWDASGRVLAASFRLAGGRLRIAVDERGASYPLTIDPVAQQAYLKASNPGNGDRFGYSVALSGDTLVVGVPGEDSDAKIVNGNQASDLAGDSGAAYVFVRSGNTWSQQAYLKASNAGFLDYFGTSVAISGDTIVIGAPGEDSNAKGVGGDQNNDLSEDSGAVYVFTRTGGVWTQQAYIKASNTDAFTSFGQSVAISRDTLIAGAPYESSAGTGVNGSQGGNGALASGAAYVFVRSASVWSQQAYLKASNTGENDVFGWSVGIDGDTAVVGAPNESSSAAGVNGNQSDDSASHSGAAYVFARNAGVWTKQAYLKASNTGTDDEFGRAVAISGNTVLVGAPGESSGATGVYGNQADNSAEKAGAAYVFTSSGSVWMQQAYLKASNANAFDNFGWSVSISGNGLVVGAYVEDSRATGVNGDQTDNSFTDSGAAYVFTRSGIGWTQLAYLKASNTNIFDYFGWAVTISGNTVAVGAVGEDSSATGVNGNQINNMAADSGAVYVFNLGDALPGAPACAEVFCTAPTDPLLPPPIPTPCGAAVCAPIVFP